MKMHLNKRGSDLLMRAQILSKTCRPTTTGCEYSLDDISTRAIDHISRVRNM